MAFGSPDADVLGRGFGGSCHVVIFHIFLSRYVDGFTTRTPEYHLLRTDDFDIDARDISGLISQALSVPPPPGD